MANSIDPRVEKWAVTLEVVGSNGLDRKTIRLEGYYSGGNPSWPVVRLFDEEGNEWALLTTSIRDACADASAVLVALGFDVLELNRRRVGGGYPPLVHR